MAEACVFVKLKSSLLGKLCEEEPSVVSPRGAVSSTAKEKEKASPHPPKTSAVLIPAPNGGARRSRPASSLHPRGRAGEDDPTLPYQHPHAFHSNGLLEAENGATADFRNIPPVEHMINKAKELMRPSSLLAAEVHDICGRLAPAATPTPRQATQDDSAPSSDVAPAAAASSSSSVAQFALDLASATQPLGATLAVRRVMDTKFYWSFGTGREFVTCALPDQGGSQAHALIIDPGFKEHFLTASMTKRYRHFWSELPEIFIGQACQLVPLLYLVCYEMVILFDSLGRQFPPWRSYPATSARWLSTSCADVAVPHPWPHVAGQPPCISPEAAKTFIQQCSELPGLLAASTQRKLPCAALTDDGCSGTTGGVLTNVFTDGSGVHSSVSSQARSCVVVMGFDIAGGADP